MTLQEDNIEQTPLDSTSDDINVNHKEGSIEKNKKIFVFKIVILVVSLVLTIVLIEGSFYFLKVFGEKNLKEKCEDFDVQAFIDSRGYSLENNFYEPNSEIDHCGPEWKYTYHINELGLRETGKELGEGDPLAIGDSFTFGFGVEDNESFSSLLGMHNAGMWGDPFDVQIESFKRNVEILKPNVVVWSFYPSHIITMMPGEWSDFCPGDRIYARSDDRRDKFLRLITKNLFPYVEKSAFGSYLLKRSNIVDVKVNSDGIEVSKNCYETKEILLYDRNLKNNSYTSQPEVNKSYQPDRDKVYDQIREYINEAKVIADQNDIEMYFVVIPSRLSLKLKEGKYSVNYKDAVIDADLPANTLRDIVINAGYSEDRFINLSEYFLVAKNWEGYYFVKDAHWNVRGHKFVSEVLKDRISL